MITVEQIESACGASEPIEFPRHDVEGPEATLGRTFYPFGFPTEVKTNEPGILALCEEMWGAFEKRSDTEPIRVDVQVLKSQTTECPPTPTYRLLLPLMVTVADADNYMVADLAHGRSHLSLSRATGMYKQYLQYCFLESAACQHIATRHTTPVHAGCVALDGRGVLLLGDSGSGKSSLSYGCARAGWTYVTDDSSFLLNGGSKRRIVGNCYQVRFRPSAAELFPELEGLYITPRVLGKPSIELPTASFPNLICAQTAQVDFLVFLNRRTAKKAELVPYGKDVARYFMRQSLYGLPEWRAVQYEAIEQLLKAEVFELRYSNLEWAVQRLGSLIRMGR